MSYGLGCLKVLDENNTPLDLVALWHRFSAANNRFIPNYVAYHYFRSKGWVPKVGLKYGAEYGTSMRLTCQECQIISSDLNNFHTNKR